MYLGLLRLINIRDNNYKFNKNMKSEFNTFIVDKNWIVK